jgi:putative oxidoreductase
MTIREEEMPVRKVNGSRWDRISPAPSHAIRVRPAGRRAFQTARTLRSPGSLRIRFPAHDKCGKIDSNTGRSTDSATRGHSGGRDSSERRAAMKKLNTDTALLLLRIIAGAVFLPHGYSKVFGIGGAAAFAHDMPGYGIPVILGYVGAYSEFFGAILLIAGLFTRLSALFLAGVMFTAVVFVQLPDAMQEAAGGPLRLFAIIRGVELPLSMFGSTLALLLAGPGACSLDGALRVEERIFGLFRKRAGLPGRD